MLVSLSVCCVLYSPERVAASVPVPDDFEVLNSSSNNMGEYATPGFTFRCAHIRIDIDMPHLLSKFGSYAHLTHAHAC